MTQQDLLHKASKKVIEYKEKIEEDQNQSVSFKWKRKWLKLLSVTMSS